MSFKASKSAPPVGSIIVAHALKKKYTYDETTALDIGSGIVLNNSSSIARELARGTDLYEGDIIRKTEIDHWLTFTLGPLVGEFQNAVDYLNQVLEPNTYLVGDTVSIADYVVFGFLYMSGYWRGIVRKAPKHIKRWFDHMGSRSEVAEALKTVPSDSIPSKMLLEGVTLSMAQPKGTSVKTSGKALEVKEDVGKFVDLPGAEMGKVVVRFPPEASGYLHVGHAKACLLNQHYRDHFKGKLILRFDDTNPAKEKEEFENVILEDLKLLKVKYDHFSRTSDHFETMLAYCEKMIKDGKAYVDDTDAETMKAEREARTESKNRNNTVDQNMSLWQEMKSGSEKGLSCCVRAKMNMGSDNGCMRDPTIYRCKNEAHPSTGNKYKVYPTYDFACPIVDSIEGVTHALRTTEYMDRDEQFFWFIDALGLRKPHIYAYSRLSLTNTVMSKRKLTWFVESGHVEGWEDPRFPTVRGVLRRGLTIEALKNFILAQGSSRSVVFMEWDKIWAFNKKIIDPISPRYTTVDESYHVIVNIPGLKEESLECDRHPKNPKVGKKTLWRSSKVIIDGDDAEALKENEKATFINLGNILIRKIHRANGKVVSIDAEPLLDDKDFKKTLKVTWLANASGAQSIPTECVYFDHIITKPVLEKNDDFKNFINKDSMFRVSMIGDHEFKKLSVGDIIQVQRRGYFIVDKAYQEPSEYSCKGSPIVLIAIPDGTPGSYGRPKPINAIVATPNQSKPAPMSSKKDKTKASASSSANVSFADSKGDPQAIHEKILKKGDEIRELKAKKADKAAITQEVNTLLALKAEYKSATGQDWKPEAAPPKAKSSSSSGSSSDLDSKIRDQGNKVRDLKAAKADKAAITQEVNTLLALKAEYKSATGQDWKPEAASPKVQAPPSSGSSDIDSKIREQGNKVRDLKAAKADKATITQEVNTLLALKAEYKSATGQDWKPDATPKSSTAAYNNNSSDLGNTLNEDIVQQGDKVRKLKSEKADKMAIDTAVKILLDLKAKYKSVTGNDWKPPAGSSTTSSKPKKEPKKATTTPAKEPSTDSGQKQTRLGMEVKKEDNLADWYSQIIIKSELMEYYDISGCYVLRPWSFSIWEAMTSFFDKEIKKHGVQNCYFPMFVSKGALQKEEDHLDDFSPEVAWVTKSGSTDMAEPIAIRPTSETVMYPTFAKWIQSHRDLPLKINQWCNVVRWEFKHPQPFLRTREFLWQEGHTAYANMEDAKEEVLTMLDLYRQVYEDLLAVPVVRGKKTEKEKFAGGDFTTTVEAFISASGRAIQGATSHYLGQNFSKMFEVTFEDPDTGNKQYVYQNSWGFTTRTIGVLVMVHGDDQGLVLPPRISPIQVVIVPCGITASLKEEDRKSLYEACQKYEDVLVNTHGVRVKGDYRENISPGWKFNHWELKGVPIRLELGPRDMKQQQFVVVRRDTGEKLVYKNIESVVTLLDKIQGDMFAKAKKELDEHMSIARSWEEFMTALNGKNLIHAPFCGGQACEEDIKDRSKGDAVVEPGSPSMGAKSLCIPFKQADQIKPTDKCVGCGGKPEFFTLFGRSY